MLLKVIKCQKMFSLKIHKDAGFFKKHHKFSK